MASRDISRRAVSSHVLNSPLELKLPKSGIVLRIMTLTDGRTVMLGRNGRAL